LFSFILGWKEYMPFFHVPSLWELIAQGPGANQDATFARA
jgi:hypothetical protein